MTTLEFMERELKRCKSNLECQKNRNAPAGDIKNLENKVLHYETVCRMLKEGEQE